MSFIFVLNLLICGFIVVVASEIFWDFLVTKVTGRRHGSMRPYSAERLPPTLRNDTSYRRAVDTGK